MRVELKHHYGWKLYDFPSAESIDEAAYRAVRASHDFLTDINHTYDAGERQTTCGGQEVRWHSVLVYRGEGAPAYSGPASLNTPYWFSVEYREPAALQQEGKSHG